MIIIWKDKYIKDSNFAATLIEQLKDKGKEIIEPVNSLFTTEK